MGWGQPPGHGTLALGFFWLGSNARHWLCDTNQVTGPLWDFISSYQLFRSVGGGKGREWLPRSMGASSWEMNKSYNQ